MVFSKRMPIPQQCFGTDWAALLGMCGKISITGTGGMATYFWLKNNFRSVLYVRTAAVMSGRLMSRENGRPSQKSEG
jgi:hypothetical protein